MAHVVVLGAGLGGTIQAYELKETLGRDDKITVISNKPYFHSSHRPIHGPGSAGASRTRSPSTLPR